MAKEKEEGEDKAEARPQIELTGEEATRLDYIVSAPLRSATRLMTQLYQNDEFYETASQAWVGPEDSRKLFLYGACKEVAKTAISLMHDKEFVRVRPADPAADAMGKLVVGSTLDSQTYRLRKMIELLTFLVLFLHKTKRDEEYRIFMNAETLDLALSQQEDFREVHEKRTILNTQFSIDELARRIADDLTTLGLKETWFLDARKLNDRKPSVFRSRRKLLLEALLVASPEERLVLGISYGRGYSQTSQAVHPLLGSHDYGKDGNHIKNVFQNMSHASLICMQIMHLAYKLAGLEDTEGITKHLGANFEKSEARLVMAQLSKEFQLGDIVLTGWQDLAVVIDSHTSKYGYKAYKIRYISRSPLPDVPEDWMEAQHILMRLMTKTGVREFYRNAVEKTAKKSPEIIPPMEKVLSLSDDELMTIMGSTLAELHKRGVLVPMLIQSGSLKQTEADELPL